MVGEDAAYHGYDGLWRWERRREVLVGWTRSIVVVREAGNWLVRRTLGWRVQ